MESARDEVWDRRNDVLTTCKAVTLRGGQRIIAVFFPQLIFIIEARSEPAEEMIKKYIKYHASLFFLHIVFVFGTKIAGEAKTQPC